MMARGIRAVFLAIAIAACLADMRPSSFVTQGRLSGRLCAWRTMVVLRSMQQALPSPPLQKTLQIGRLLGYRGAPSAPRSSLSPPERGLEDFYSTYSWSGPPELFKQRKESLRVLWQRVGLAV